MVDDDDGFFSAVEDRDNHGSLLVRTRVRGDADQLAAAVDGTVLETPGSDYRFRVRVGKDVWARYVASRAEEIDYDNFKERRRRPTGHGTRPRVRRGLERPTAAAAGSVTSSSVQAAVM